MKNILLTIIIFSSFFAYSQQGLKVIEATKQGWSGGQEGSGFGVYYKVSFIPLYSSEKLTLDSLWVGDRYYSIDMLAKEQNIVNDFEVGDTLWFQVSYRNYWSGFSPENFNPDNNKVSPPYPYKGEAIIEYRIDNKRKFYEIEELKELEYLAYP
ncbi:MAG: hypothetical protein JXL97_13675 [Bacteroidales bacterium]|nr:hypothetical protein [Bacteroidales bacterium]